MYVRLYAWDGASDLAPTCVHPHEDNPAPTCVHPHEDNPAPTCVHPHEDKENNGMQWVCMLHV